MKRMVLLVVMVLMAWPRAARAADASLPGEFMDGPFAHAFAERCDALRAKSTDIRCKRVAARRAGKLAVEVHRAGNQEVASYYLSMKTAQGWYVSHVPLQIQTENGHAGSYDVGRIDAIEVRAETVAGSPGPAVSLLIRETWKTYCGACEPPRRRPTRVFGQSHFLVCALGPLGNPTCAPPLYTMGEKQRPPRLVAGKIVTGGAEVGKEGEYGQSWESLADGRYALSFPDPRPQD